MDPEFARQQEYYEKYGLNYDPHNTTTAIFSDSKAVYKQPSKVLINEEEYKDIKPRYVPPPTGVVIRKPYDDDDDDDDDNPFSPPLLPLLGWFMGGAAGMAMIPVAGMLPFLGALGAIGYGGLGLVTGLLPYNEEEEEGKVKTYKPPFKDTST